MRLPVLLLLLVLLAGSLGFARYVSRGERYPMKDVVVPITGKQYRLHSDTAFTVFRAFATDAEARRREAVGLVPYLAERAGRSGDTSAVVLAIRPGFARLFPSTEAGWYRFAVRDGSWRLVGEAPSRRGLGQGAR